MGSHRQLVTLDTDLTMPPLSTNVLILLVLGSAIALPDLMRTARQVVFEGFPEGLPDLTPQGVKLSLGFTLILKQTVSHSTCALLGETRPPSCVLMAQFSTSSTSCVTGGTTLTVLTNLLSTN